MAAHRNGYKCRFLCNAHKPGCPSSGVHSCRCRSTLNISRFPGNRHNTDSARYARTWQNLLQLLPAYSQLPAEPPIGRFPQHLFVLFKLTDDIRGLRTQARRRTSEMLKKGGHRLVALHRGIPLRRRQSFRPLRIACSFFQQKSHRILVGREKLKQWLDAQPLSHFLQGIFVARQSSTVDKDVKAGILAFNDDIERSAHAGSLPQRTKEKQVNPLNCVPCTCAIHHSDGCRDGFGSVSARPLFYPRSAPETALLVWLCCPYNSGSRLRLVVAYTSRLV